MKIAYRMFFVPARNEEPMPIGFALGSSLAIAALGVLILGIYPEPLVQAVRFSTKFLP
jgi:hypothetical protein